MIARAAFLLLSLTVTTWAATSTAWEVSGFTDLLKGRLSGLTLTADGFLELGPSIRFNAALDQPAFWSVAASPDGNIYGSTGHSGKVFKITPDGRATLLWTAPQSEVFALCTDAHGQLYAGTSPNGGVYRIDNGQGTEIWHSPEKYIWALQPSGDSGIFIGTGEHGRVYRLSTAGQAQVYYDTGQSNVTSLALDAHGRLYVGTDPNGILYTVTAENRGTILLDSALPEIRAIAIDKSGVVYASAMGGAVTTRSAGTGTAAATFSTTTVAASAPTVITVTESANAQAGKTPAAVSTTPAATAQAASASGVAEVSGVDKSAIYKINLDRTVETVRTSKEDNVYDILLDGDSLLFSTDNHARIYRLRGTRTDLVSQPGEGEATRLLRTGAGLYAALSNPARLLQFGPAGGGTGAYESQVHDSTAVAHWGHLRWYGGGSGMTFKTRTGNAARPDSTWSAWSVPISDPASALISSPAARFIQFRAEWPAGSKARLNTVDLPFLPQNSAPGIHSITVASIIGTNTAKSSAAASGSSSAYTVTVTDTGEAPAAGSGTTASQTVSRLQTTQTQISWQADDPDGDKLVYTVYFRAEDETDWQLIRSRMYENTLLLDPDVLADGRYFFRVVASDAPANAPQYARQAELVSTPVLIDNTPPTVSLGTPKRDGATFDLDIEATDKTSPLRLCEYSLDAGFWQPIESLDGVTDSPHERFHIQLEKLRPGEHLLVVRVYDIANNAGLARVVIR